MNQKKSKNMEKEEGLSVNYLKGGTPPEQVLEEL